MVDIFKALAEENRLRILALLMVDEMCVCEIENCLNMNQSNVSRHLTALRRCGILEGYKKAQWVYYKINNNFIEKNPDLYAYLTKELKQLASYNSDCEKMASSKLQCLCDVKIKE
ncbi:metalloregulator ArsR/SmtB family transcription factor [Clostridium bowmanii]|uniref:ArsR/SmtB family transcription factor n=1 Tax=Clostridium bowmanii TaxID=132925 RepID=UPI001C0CFF4B|nr:metalloregulator ArsR/SmtB family transcription factor [Clostridium bowmanii]MBU3188501.1 metalloregulator ArsR/SmtB family transcription factor [Clostridium bowmanii]MCA1072885.1 metalloregulator ArsR/SmtB family transcription factor [Clostridium bowmanii]